MKSHLATSLLFAALQCTLLASSNFPPDKLTFHNDGKLDLAITEPCESSGIEKWNTITIRFPEPIKFSSKIIITGTVILKSDSSPSHIGFNLLNLSDRFGFAKVPASADGETSFSISLGDFVRSAELGGGTIEEGEEIWSIRVYASFPEPVDSTITLKSFEMKQE